MGYYRAPRSHRALETPLATLLPLTPERRAAELRHAEEREEFERVGRRFVAAGLLVVLSWQVAGAVIMVWIAHVREAELGQGLFSRAFLVGHGGGFFSLMVFYVRSAERGEW